MSAVISTVVFCLIDNFAKNFCFNRWISGNRFQKTGKFKLKCKEYNKLFFKVRHLREAFPGIYIEHNFGGF